MDSQSWRKKTSTQKRFLDVFFPLLALAVMAWFLYTLFGHINEPDQQRSVAPSQFIYSSNPEFRIDQPTLRTVEDTKFLTVFAVIPMPKTVLPTKALYTDSFLLEFAPGTVSPHLKEVTADCFEAFVDMSDELNGTQFLTRVQFRSIPVAFEQNVSVFLANSFSFEDPREYASLASRPGDQVTAICHVVAPDL